MGERNKMIPCKSCINIKKCAGVYACNCSQFGLYILQENNRYINTELVDKIIQKTIKYNKNNYLEDFVK